MFRIKGAGVTNLRGAGKGDLVVRGDFRTVWQIAANKPGDGSWESHVTGFYPAMSGAMGRFI